MEQNDKAIADLNEKMKSGKSDGIKIAFDTLHPGDSSGFWRPDEASPTEKR